jgi:flavin-dependent dehydrogenase
MPAAQQVHKDLVLHLAPDRGAGGAERVLSYRLPYAFCTFDYRALCRLLGDRTRTQGVEFMQTRLRGWTDGAVLTDDGPIRARCVVDATGWRAAVSSTIDPGYVQRGRLSCGLEAELPQPAANHAGGLHFWAGLGTVWPGYAWSFPSGATARLGVIAYEQPAAGGGYVNKTEDGGGRTDSSSVLRPPSSSSKGLREMLDAFLDGPAAGYWSPDGTAAWSPGSGTPTAGRHLHGGFLPAAPRRPVVGPIFNVGDAAGHCFALTGEGIRPALAFSVRCGQLLQQTIDGTLTPDQARATYTRYVTLRAPYFHLMRLLQRMVSRMADRGLARYSLWAHPGLVFRFLMAQYLWPANPAPLVRPS